MTGVAPEPVPCAVPAAAARNRDGAGGPPIPRRRRRLFAAIAAVAGCLAGLLALPASAAAQQMASGLPAGPSLAQLPGITPVEVPTPNPNPEQQEGPVGVRERPRPELEAVGIQTRWGVLTPSATASGVFDSNVFATETHVESDFLIHLRPELKLDSGEGVVQYLAGAYGEYVRYLVHDSLSNLNGGANLGVTYSPNPDLTFQSQTGATYGHQDPATFSIAIPNSAVKRLPPYSILTQTFTGTREVNRIGLSLVAGFQREDYSKIVLGGVTFNQSVLDADAFSLAPKFSYAATPLIRVFVQPEILRRNYDDPLRNSTSYTFKTGSDFELTQLAKGSAFAGYRVRQYDAAAIGSISSPSYGLNLSWYPTELITVLVAGKQDFADTTITSGPGIPVVINIKTVKGEVDYEIMRQLVATASAAFENDDYRGIKRVDNSYSAGGLLTYTLNRNAAVYGEYKYMDRRSSLIGFNYDRHQIGVGLRVQY